MTRREMSRAIIQELALMGVGGSPNRVMGADALAEIHEERHTGALGSVAQARSSQGGVYIEERTLANRSGGRSRRQWQPIVH